MRKKIIYNPATDKFENMDPDVPTISKRLNQFRRKDDQLPVLASAEKMSDYELLEAYKNADAEKKKIFEPMLKRLTKQPSAQEKWNAIHKSMTPKQRREFYKDKKEKPKDMYDDIPKVVLPDPAPVDDYIKMKSEIFNNFSEAQKEEEQFKKLMERKEDPDLQNGLGSLGYKVIKD